MKKIFLYSLIFIAFNAQAQDAVAIIASMKKAINEVNQSTFILETKERWGTEYKNKTMSFRMQESPKKVYMKDMDTGVELLYAEGWNDNKGFINPNGFPWVNLSLNVFDSKVVAENHHTIFDLGLGFVNKLLAGFESTIEGTGKSKASIYKYKGTVVYDGKTCHEIWIFPPVDFKYRDHVMKKDQKLMDLSREIVASDYLIKEKNNLNYTRTIKKGTSLSVPTAYAKSVKVYIDTKTYFPVVQMLFDERGLFEKYSYKKLDVKPSFEKNEFTSECDKYGF